MGKNNKTVIWATKPMTEEELTRMDWRRVSGWDVALATIVGKIDTAKLRLKHFKGSPSQKRSLEIEVEALFAQYDNQNKACEADFQKLWQTGEFITNPITSDELTKAAAGIFTR